MRVGIDNTNRKRKGKRKEGGRKGGSRGGQGGVLPAQDPQVADEAARTLG